MPYRDVPGKELEHTVRHALSRKATGEIVHTVLLIVAEVRDKRKAHPAPDLVPEQLPAADAEEGRGRHRAPIRKDNGRTRHVTNPAVRLLRVAALVGHDVHAVCKF
jgi:hypothetical protein